VAGTTNRIYEFGSFRLDVAERLLLRAGTPLQLTPMLFETLLLLVENSGHLLSKDELMEKLWPDRFVEEVNLSKTVSRLRKILEETPGQQFVATVPGQGYRFIGEVRDASDNGKAPEALIIERPTGQTVVVDQNKNETRQLALIPAVERRKRRIGRSFGFVTVMVAAAVLVWLALPAKPPRLVATTQITNDGRSKWGGYKGPGVLTDGSRIYTLEDSLVAQASTLVQVSVSGGETAPISIPFTQVRITDLDPRSSELLMLPWSSAAELDSPLWAYSTINGSYRRLGDLTVSDATWTPDGSILFTQGQELWRAKSDGTQQQLVATFDGIIGSPRESPDGSVVRVTLEDLHHNSTAIWQVSRNGTNAHPLLAGWNEPSREVAGSWTPDGRYYIFQSLRDGKWGIWALREPSGLNRKPRGPFRLTTGPIDYVSPTISLDGKKLYAVGIQPRGELMRFDRDRRQFVPFLNGASVDGLDFSADGNSIAYVSVPEGQLWRSRADGSDRQQLTYPPMVAAEPRWSPDGNQIAFIARLPGKNWKVHVIPAAGGTPSELSSELVNEFDPAWSPDGKKLVFGRPVFGSESATAQPAIYTLDLEGREITAVPGSDGLFSPRWSHQRDLAALSSDSQRLLLYSPATSNWTELASGGVAFPRWSHDDKYIYFDTVGTDRFVCRVQVETRKIERIASLEYLRRGGSFGSWSGLAPDDSPLFLRYAGAEEIYAFDLDLP